MTQASIRFFGIAAANLHYGILRNTLAKLCSVRLLLGLLISVSFGVASGQSVLEHARLKVYFFDIYISTVKRTCAEKQPELSESLSSVQQQFHQKLLPEIELGREFGKTLVASSGNDIQKEAERLALQGLMTDLLAASNQSSRQLCEEAIREFNDRAKWTIDDFLREDFQSLMMDAGNRQGLPCDVIAMRLEGIARRFVDSRGKPPDTQQLLDQLLFLEVRDLEAKVSSCIAVQARAVEY